MATNTHGHNAAPDAGHYIVSSRMKTVIAVCIFLGAVGFVVGLMKDPTRTWMAYLLPFFYFMSLALGGVFFTAIQHVTKAGWSVNVRRICESFSQFLPYGAAAALAFFLFGAPRLYEWFDKAKVAEDALLQHKAGYLNPTFFVIRLALFFGLWLVFSKVMVGRSIKQDETGDPNITRKQVGLGIAFLLVFAISYSLFSVDLLMSVQPHWYSTIYGVYCFAGLFQTTMAVMILTILYLKSKGHLASYVNENHLHDLGKFLFAFTVFWAYIAFSQYMLIWYANLPEETMFIIPRTTGAWLPVSLLLLIGKFIVPFLALLPRWAKRNPAHLGALSIWILIMQYVDLYWLVYPAYHEEAPVFGLTEICLFVGFLGVFLFAVTRFLSLHNLVPKKDPRIEESLHHHVVY
jgi:hypothetical protein